MTVGLALALLSTTGGPLELDWSAPPGCPDAAQVHRRVEQAITEPFGEPLRATGRVEVDSPTSARLRLEIATSEGAVSVRTLAGSTCTEVTDAATLVLIIAIDPNAQPPLSVPPAPPSNEAAEDADAAAPAPEAQAPAAPDSAATPSDAELPPPIPAPQPRAPAEAPTPPAATQREPSQRRLGVDLVAAGGLGVGVLPTPGGVAAVHAALLIRRWRVEVGATYEPPITTKAPTNPEVGARAQLWSIDVRGCPTFGQSAVTVPICVGVRAGSVHAEGTGALSRRGRASAPWTAASLAPTLLWRPKVGRGRFLIGARAEVSASLTRPGFQTTEATSVLEAGPVGGQLTGLIGVSPRIR